MITRDQPDVMVCDRCGEVLYREAGSSIWPHVGTNLLFCSNPIERAS